MDPVLPAGPSRSASEASAEERAQKLKRQAEESPWYVLWEGVRNGGMGMGEYGNGCMEAVWIQWENVLFSRHKFVNNELIVKTGLIDKRKVQETP